MDVTPNCRAARGRPNREHHCTGCACPCHGVRPPLDFRARVEAARAARREQPAPGAGGEARPGAGQDGGESC